MRVIQRLLTIFLLQVTATAFAVSQNDHWKRQDLSGYVPYVVIAIAGNLNGIITAGAAESLMVSTNFGTSWTLHSWDSFWLGAKKIIVHPSGRFFACIAQRVWYSDTRGANWQECSWDGGSSPHLPVFCEDLALDEKGYVYSSGKWTGVVRSTDLGNTWSHLPCPGTSFPLIHITRNGNIVVYTPFYALNPGPPDSYVRCSTDGGSTWNVGRLETTPTAFVSTSNGSIFAGTPNGIYHSTDCGATWNHTTDPASRDVYSLATNALDEIYAGTRYGVYRSTNHGTAWTPFLSGIGYSKVSALYCDVTGYLFAGLDGSTSPGAGGLFRTVSSTDGRDTIRGSVTVPYALHQNFPNPFNPGTTISYEIPGPEHVTLTVTDVLGREVAVLVNENTQSGRHQVRFDGTHLTSGVYFYRLKVGEFSQAKRLLLLR